MSSALIYAELLSNIRQVSVIASLDTPSNQDTRATLSGDRQQLKLVHDDTTVLLILPAQVAAIPSLRQPVLGSREISWRLALPSTAPNNNGRNFADVASAPWSASKLPEESQVSCRNCEIPLLGAGSIQSWKDLPSENWAEMMDFWHCHKPHIHGKDPANDQHEDHLEEKGYGARNRFMARRGVGFVDLTYFLVSEKDCCAIKLDQARGKASERTVSREPIHCRQCGTTVGGFDDLANGLRLYKWSVSVSTTASKGPTAYPLSYFITAHLLSQISSQAVTKFIMHSDKMSMPILHIWVFSPHLTISVSTTGPTASKPIAASKIFYRTLSEEEYTAMLENEGMNFEEVQLPAEAMIELENALQQSTMSIPDGSRTFRWESRVWDVGFLQRFVEGEGDKVI